MMKKYQSIRENEGDSIMQSYGQVDFKAIKNQNRPSDTVDMIKLDNTMGRSVELQFTGKK